MEYRIIDGDTHINEAPDLWEKRVPQRLKDRAPKLIKAPHGGAAWSFDGGKELKSVFSYAQCSWRFTGPVDPLL